MRKILLLILCAALAASCAKNDDNLAQVGDRVPQFTITSVDGSSTFSSEPGAKPILIYFLWSECPDCHRQTPTIVDLWQRNGSVEIACIARGRGEQATLAMARTYWNKVADDFNYSSMPPLYYDANAVIYSKFAMTGVPRIYITDRNGIIRAAISDVQSYEALEQTLEFITTTYQ